MPEYDISYGNIDITPEVFTTRVWGFDDRYALQAALDQLGTITGADGQPAAWTVLSVEEVPEPIFTPQTTVGEVP